MTRLVEEDGNDKHWEYGVEIETNGTYQIVFKRYSDFKALSEALSQHYADCPALPRKHRFCRQTPEFAERRRTELDDYIRSLQENPKLADHKAFKAFLE